MKIVLLWLALATTSLAETAEERAERFLTAMGGRAAWSQVKFAHVEAVHDDLALAQPFTNKIWNDFTAPRVRFEAKNAQIDRRRAIDDGKGWRSRDGVVSESTPAQIEEDRRWWEANIYRTLHRLAVNDPELTARAVGEHRLEIFRADGKRLNWFVLNPRGEPMLFGTWDNETGGAMGPLASNGSVNYPKWGAMPDGSWRYEVVRLVTAEKAPVAISFTTP
ncbi:hypothetical protein [Oleiharenicola lentus]|uniref:hypothetical protein n=1 Tax=Oleiharenicola lentus TaxID=2508720 RepID=UPI003F680213